MLTVLDGIDNNEWLLLRQNGIGGSECSAILGLNPYMTNVDLWEIKTGRRKPDDLSNNSAVIFGKEHEFELIKSFADTNSEKYDVFHRKNDMRFSKKNDFMIASLDAELLDKSNGQKGVLEIKTCQVNTYNFSKWQNQKIPDNYYCQVLHYLSVTDYSFAIVYALLRFHDGDEDYKEIKIVKEKHLDEIDFLENAEADFWENNVLKNQPPYLKVNI